MGTRIETRFAFRNQPSVTIQPVSSSGEGGKPIAAELLDISRGGAKLVLDADAQLAGKVMLHFHELNIDLGARVCWSRQSEGEDVWAACLFEPPLPTELIELLLDQGYLERRKHVREETRLTAQAKWQCGEKYAVGVRDFSSGGLCLWAPRGAARDQRLLLEFEQADEKATADVLVQVQWQIKFDEGYLIGCSFLNRQGLATLRRLLPARRRAETREQRHLGRLRGSLGRLVSFLKGSPAQ